MKNKAAQQLGKLGGQKTVSLYGKEHFKKITKGWPKGKKRKETGKSPGNLDSGVSEAVGD